MNATADKQRTHFEMTHGQLTIARRQGQQAGGGGSGSGRRAWLVREQSMRNSCQCHDL